ncbi:MAG: ATP-dependent nuclease [Cyclobacteriaceae bacterium]
MFLKSFHARNYRTLENIDIHFENHYTALSGKNNSGKSNVMKAIRNVLSSGFYFKMSDELIGYGDFNYNKDFTNWNTKGKDKEKIEIKFILELDKTTDSGIYNFIRDLILKEQKPKTTTSDKELLTIEFLVNPDSSSEYNISFGETTIDTDLQKRETLRRIKTSETIIFHNSTENETFPPFRVNRESIKNFINDKDRKEITNRVDAVVKKVQKSLKVRQEELATFLGRLEDKYEVSLSIEGLKLDRETIEISLKEKGFDVTLDDWGSGTKNRTLIFLSLLNAKRCQSNPNESERLNPILLVEEPESFLHPSAQAEFGRTLQDLASELKIQVIVSTHSP